MITCLHGAQGCGNQLPFCQLLPTRQFPDRKCLQTMLSRDIWGGGGWNQHCWNKKKPNFTSWAGKYSRHRRIVWGALMEKQKRFILKKNQTKLQHIPWVNHNHNKIVYPCRSGTTGVAMPRLQREAIPPNDNPTNRKIVFGLWTKTSPYKTPSKEKKERERERNILKGKNQLCFSGFF